MPSRPRATTPVCVQLWTGTLVTKQLLELCAPQVLKVREKTTGCGDPQYAFRLALSSSNGGGVTFGMSVPICGPDWAREPRCCIKCASYSTSDVVVDSRR